jgi:hypothetical protein
LVKIAHTVFTDASRLVNLSGAPEVEIIPVGAAGPISSFVEEAGQTHLGCGVWPIKSEGGALVQATN